MKGLLFFTIILLLSTNTVAAAWWNTSFGFCRNLTWTEGNNIARMNEPVDKWINTSSWNTKPFNNSIRIVNQSCNNGGNEIPLSTYNETYSGNNYSTFNLVFPLNVTKGGTVNYSMYFHDANIDSPSYTTDLIVTKRGSGSSESWEIEFGSVSFFVNESIINDKLYLIGGSLKEVTTGQDIGRAGGASFLFDYHGGSNAGYDCSERANKAIIFWLNCSWTKPGYEQNQTQIIAYPYANAFQIIRKGNSFEENRNYFIQRDDELVDSIADAGFTRQRDGIMYRNWTEGSGGGIPGVNTTIGDRIYMGNHRYTGTDAVVWVMFLSENSSTFSTSETYHMADWADWDYVIMRNGESTIPYQWTWWLYIRNHSDYEEANPSFLITPLDTQDDRFKDMPDPIIGSEEIFSPPPPTVDHETILNETLKIEEKLDGVRTSLITTIHSIVSNILNKIDTVIIPSLTSILGEIQEISAQVEIEEANIVKNNRSFYVLYELDGVKTDPVNITTEVNGTVLQPSEFVHTKISDGVYRLQVATSSVSLNTTPQFEEVVTGNSTGTSVTSSAITAVDNDLYVATVATRTATNVNSIDGLGLTWTLAKRQCGARNIGQTEIWYASGNTNATGNVTATLSASVPSVSLSVVRYSGVNTADPIGNVTSANTLGDNAACPGSGTDTANYGVNLTTTSQNSVILGAVYIRQRTHTPGAGFTERTEVITIPGNANAANHATEDQYIAAVNSKQKVNGTLSDTIDWSVVAVEIHATTADIVSLPLVITATFSDGTKANGISLIR